MFKESFMSVSILEGSCSMPRRFTSLEVAVTAVSRHWPVVHLDVRARIAACASVQPQGASIAITTSSFADLPSGINTSRYPSDFSLDSHSASHTLQSAILHLPLSTTTNTSPHSHHTTLTMSDDQKVILVSSDNVEIPTGT